MGKRKHDDEDYLRRKIQRYENKLKKKRKERSPSPQSLSSRDAYDENHDENVIDEEIDETPVEISVVNIEHDASQSHTPSDGCAGNETATTDVPSEILEILGEARKMDPALGKNVQQEVAERWGKILLDGLDKEYKDSLKTKMLVPENLTLVRAPKLNPEVISILSESAKNRDKHLESAQNQLGTGIAGLVNLTNDLIQSQSIEKLDMLKRISEISQLLLDLHHEQTFNRRKLVIPLLDKSFWNITKGIKRDEFLFGTKLGENIKTSKDIERTGLQIKKPTPPTTGTRRTGPQAGNVRGPPRRINYNMTAAQATIQRQQPPTSMARRTNYPNQRSRQTGANRKFDKMTRR